MFPYEKVTELNGLENEVYAYITKHRDAVENMTIRAVADAAHVSTTTILRFVTKMGYAGFSELKFALKQDRLNQEHQQHPEQYDITVPLADFFRKVTTDDFGALLDKAVDWLAAAREIFTFGIGSSGYLAQYGARYIANTGKLTLPILDPFQPLTNGSDVLADSVFLILSVSGETKEVLDMVSQIRRTPAKVIAVTNRANSPLAHLSDLVIAYYMPEIKNGTLNNTTQVPVVYLLELLGHRLELRESAKRQAHTE
ncbi:MurR/RpiR family transcriptional regulator [Schleiferilactobacillus shenzhenensis]|uniref:Arabinose-5-phosphate isomerase n=1 Tax=Schleiferilactobacillus shenzhenensis LY-73 TaxID=1231336 RepID=U4TRD3_9LACO|nr:MurR/RpiR family transcriptional regulator [Schleiferilactobacillus shenzhenensis]ERL66015.1 arabinose-5-phosphate isomerase [Schleiferilactobacillus shenzhenensis LY-73]